ncbi:MULTISPECIES: cytochrome c [Rhodomicrobium]|uniref:c-type cytochrome n=1 Tax=Rhodomicrobium TaxID=1068 RepID=UPI001AECBD87|nr:MULTISPECIES: cytochrome c [Rhodomicrobium]
MHRLLAALLAAACLHCAAPAAFAETAPASDDKEAVQRGRYLYTAGGCASCHAAPASAKCDDPNSADDLKPVGGRCLKSDFGTFYVPNITQDKTAGLGNWTEQNFITAMTTGTSPAGANYYPAFPYASYQRMPRGDLADLWAFLKTLEPIPSSVPGHDLSFPYNIRRGLSVWKSLYLDGKTFEPDPAKSAQVNRGAYLVEGPGHCGECHTPRDSLGGMEVSKRLSGAPDPEGKGYTPNITPDKTGIGAWSERDISFALQSGFTPGGDVIGGAMAKVQKNMAKLTKDDRDAIAAYLKSVPPVAHERPKRK